MSAHKKNPKKESRRLKANLIFLSFIILCAFFVLSLPKIISLSTPRDTNGAKITFAFDDGFTSGLTEAAPVLNKYGFSGVMYVSTGCTDNTDVCRSRFPANKSFLTWEEIKELHEKYTWEIGSHTENHKPLTELTDAEKEEEIVGSKETLMEHGYDAISFASPQGDYNPTTLALVMKHYASHRGFKDTGANDIRLYDNALLSVLQVQEGVPMEEIKEAIDSAIELQQWLILVFHDIKDNPSQNPADYEYSTAELETIAQYVKEKQSDGQIEAVTVEDIVASTEPNLIPNNSFETSEGDAWVTNISEFVTIDYDNNGSYPSPSESAKIIGSSKVADLHTSLIPVQEGATYKFSAFVNTIEQKSGELSFVVDEYTASKKWIRAVWLGKIAPGNVSYITASYTPQSPVSAIRIQANVTEDAEGTIYLDNYQLYKSN